MGVRTVTQPRSIDKKSRFLRTLRNSDTSSGGNVSGTNSDNGHSIGNDGSGAKKV